MATVSYHRSPKASYSRVDLSPVTDPKLIDAGYRMEYQCFTGELIVRAGITPITDHDTILQLLDRGQRVKTSA